MLPRHGTVYGAFLLARAARVAPRHEIPEWVDAARRTGSFLGAAIDLQPTARHLIDIGAANHTPEGVAISPALRALSDAADGETLRAIARILLTASPPQWLRIAAAPSEIRRQYIPHDQLAALTWLEPHLDELLESVHATVTADASEILRRSLGGAAERVVLAGLVQAGENPLHVAEISDSYGYDIETRTPTTRCIEVKGAGQTTRGGFHLSRNEYETCRARADCWCLVQVTFTSAAHVAATLRPSHVSDIRKLTSHDLLAIIPEDVPAFRWTESALIKPPEEAWMRAELTLDPTFETDGFGVPIPPF